MNRSTQGLHAVVAVIQMSTTLKVNNLFLMNLKMQSPREQKYARRKTRRSKLRSSQNTDFINDERCKFIKEGSLISSTIYSFKNFDKYHKRSIFPAPQNIPTKTRASTKHQIIKSTQRSDTMFFYTNRELPARILRQNISEIQRNLNSRNLNLKFIRVAGMLYTMASLCP